MTPKTNPGSEQAALKSDTITVCDQCFCATCWQGHFYCEDYQTAGIVKKTRSELMALNTGEHPSHWLTDEERAKETTQP